MWPFEREEGRPAYVARLSGAERAVLLDVVDDVIELLGGRDADGSRSRATGHPLDALRIELGPLTAPADSAVLRLLPDASREDPAVTAEFRRLTEGDLRATKVANLLKLRAVVDGARPEAIVLVSEGSGVAAALTDLRLVVSERLELRTDEDADAVMHLAVDDEVLDPADQDAHARRFLATVYVVLSMLQDSLVELMLEGLPDSPLAARRTSRPGDGPDGTPGAGTGIG